MGILSMAEMQAEQQKFHPLTTVQENVIEQEEVQLEDEDVHHLLFRSKKTIKNGIILKNTRILLYLCYTLNYKSTLPCFIF